MTSPLLWNLLKSVVVSDSLDLLVYSNSVSKSALIMFTLGSRASPFCAWFTASSDIALTSTTEHTLECQMNVRSALVNFWVFPTPQCLFGPLAYLLFQISFTHLYQNRQSQYIYSNTKTSVIKYEKNIWKTCEKKIHILVV